MRKIVYMEWVKLKTPARYEIGGSGVIPVKIDELPEARNSIDINDFNLYGYRPLLAQIAERYEVAPSQVVSTQGTSMANYLAYASVVGHADEVLVEKPAYEPLLSIPRLLGASIKRFGRPFNRGFKIDLNEIASKLTSRTKLIVLTNMHNPSGVLTPNEVVAEIGKLARKVGAYVLVDEVYLDFLFEQRPKSAVHLGPNFMISSSLTKAYGLDGLRCGWVLASPKHAETIWRLQDFFGVNGTIPAEKTATEAFEHLDRFIERTRGILARNRPLIDKFLASHKDKLSWVTPDGGPVAFPRMLGVKDTRVLAADLKAKYHTTIIPGYFFEMPQHFRLGMGGSTDTLRGGLRQLSKALLG